MTKAVSIGIFVLLMQYSVIIVRTQALFTNVCVAWLNLIMVNSSWTSSSSTTILKVVLPERE